MESNGAHQLSVDPAGVPAHGQVGPAQPELQRDAVVGGEVAFGADDSGNGADDLVGAPGGVTKRHVVTAGPYAVKRSCPFN